jgi:hypothetical protein
MNDKLYAKYVGMDIKLFTCCCDKEIEVDSFIDSEEDPILWCSCRTCGDVFEWGNMTVEEYDALFENPINSLPEVRTIKQ